MLDVFVSPHIPREGVPHQVERVVAATEDVDEEGRCGESPAPDEVVQLSRVDGGRDSCEQACADRE